ncbi:heme exporter protein CcmD [Neorhizobium sp. T786]|uniref:heme exporter protein CcmD n=1 Tax=Pseudorhizobium xiangyangii TaxID=2883104 RepID=UPI001CFFB4CC|nr:heme exporter protein CcmD [Neorhizobium xiangyangii]MCB5202318.1 heme exporter protein CcmD [Neorhizobium xiangyangii]
MSHGFYIALSYGSAAVIVALLIGWVWLDGRARRRELAELEAAGIHRRSADARKGGSA